ncbi:Thermoresistant gluconokinase [Providencia stuartii]|nr:Thermoresistant gluconokinase [Providencia stuartii]
MSDTQAQNYTFVFMGVSGSGKSAVASGVAQKTNAAFLDGDFLHPRANIQKNGFGPRTE